MAAASADPGPWYYTVSGEPSIAKRVLYFDVDA